MREVLFKDRYEDTFEIRSHMISDELLVIYTKGAIELGINELALVVEKLEKLMERRPFVVEGGG